MSTAILPKTASQDARIELRVTAEIKHLLESAYRLAGFSSLKDFIIATSVPVARQTVEQHRLISLNKAESQRFLDAMLNPPAPNKRLTQAAARHRKLIRSGK